MARIENNKKGFKVISVSAVELAATTGAPGLCDYCCNPSKQGFYIAVINSRYCPECYQAWLNRAKKYADDKPIEDRNFNVYNELLGIE